MSKIYTRRGDDGFTSLPSAGRVAKTDSRIVANGEIDELVALLGVVRADMAPDDTNRERLAHVQTLLMAVMAHVARSGQGDMSALQTETAAMERLIDGMDTGVPFDFVCPGRTHVEALLHLARAKVRTVERCLWAVHTATPLDGAVMRYVNRLSDYLFALACQY